MDEGIETIEMEDIQQQQCDSTAADADGTTEADNTDINHHHHQAPPVVVPPPRIDDENDNEEATHRHVVVPTTDTIHHQSLSSSSSSSSSSSITHAFLWVRTHVLRPGIIAMVAAALLFSANTALARLITSSSSSSSSSLYCSTTPPSQQSTNLTTSPFSNNNCTSTPSTSTTAASYSPFQVLYLRALVVTIGCSLLLFKSGSLPIMKKGMSATTTAVVAATTTSCLSLPDHHDPPHRHGVLGRDCGGECGGNNMAVEEEDGIGSSSNNIATDATISTALQQQQQPGVFTCFSVPSSLVGPTANTVSIAIPSPPHPLTSSLPITDYKKEEEEIEEEEDITVRIYRRHISWALIRGVFGTIAMACSYYAVSTLPSLAEAVVLYGFNPVFSSIAARIVLNEHFTAFRLLGVLLFMAGVIVSVDPEKTFGNLGEGSSAEMWVGRGVALIGSFFNGVAIVAAKKMQPPPLLSPAPRSRVAAGSSSHDGVLPTNRNPLSSTSNTPLLPHVGSLTPIIPNTTTTTTTLVPFYTLHWVAQAWWQGFLGLALAPLASFIFTFPPIQSGNELDLLVFVAQGLCAFGGQCCVGFAVQRENAAIIGVLWNFDVVFAIMWQATLLGATVTWYEGLGVVFVFLGSIVCVLEKAWMAAATTNDDVISSSIEKENSPINNAVTTGTKNSSSDNERSILATTNDGEKHPSSSSLTQRRSPSTCG